MKMSTLPIFVSVMHLVIVSEACAQTSVLTGQVSRNISQRLEANTVYVPQRNIPNTVTRTIVIEKPTVTHVYLEDRRTFWQKHPKVKAATIGAGVGAGAGAVTGLISGRGIVRGAAIGAGTGAGVGLVRASNTMKRHPIMRDVATGGLVGLGIGGAASRNRGWLKGAAVGSAVGLGWGLLKNGLN